MAERPLPEADQSFGERLARTDERERTLAEIETAAELAEEKTKAAVVIAVYSTVLGAILLPIWALIIGVMVRGFRWSAGI